MQRFCVVVCAMSMTVCAALPARATAQSVPRNYFQMGTGTWHATGRFANRNTVSFDMLTGHRQADARHLIVAGAFGGMLPIGSGTSCVRVGIDGGCFEHVPAITFGSALVGAEFRDSRASVSMLVGPTLYHAGAVGGGANAHAEIAAYMGSRVAMVFSARMLWLPHFRSGEPASLRGIGLGVRVE